MKYDLPCEVVQDLLPSYIDSLTSETTKESIDSHLENCENCRKIKDSMTMNCGQSEVNISEKKIFKKTKRKIIKTFALVFACVVALGAALWAFLGWYESSDIIKTKDLVIAVNKVNAEQLEFCVSPDKENTNEFLMWFDGSESDYVVTKEQIKQIKEKGYIYQILIKCEKYPIGFVNDDVLYDGSHQLEVWSDHSTQLLDKIYHGYEHIYQMISFDDLGVYKNYIDDEILIAESTPIGEIEVTENKGVEVTESPDAEKGDLVIFDINSVE